MKRVYNVSTSPLFLPLYDEEEVIYRTEEEDDEGFLRGVRKKRTETRVKETVAIDGCHHEKMHDPNFADLTEDEYERLEMCPGFEGMLASKKVRVENIEDED